MLQDAAAADAWGCASAAGIRRSCIVSASYKTDVPAFYGRWFMARLRQGFVEGVNSWSGKPFTIDLRPEAVDGIVFWTRNIEPFEAFLPEIAARGAPFYVQYGVLDYPRALERAVVAAARAVAAMHRLSERWGSDAVVWRYDPIVFSSLTPPSWHEETFGRLAEALRGVVGEVALSFAQIYRKTARNMTAAARSERFAWSDSDDEEKKSLLTRLQPVAAANAMRLGLCGQRRLLVPGIEDTRCIDAERLTRIGGMPVSALRRAHRKGCGCWQSKDVGAYNTCLHGCRYCYAVESDAGARAGFRFHDEAAPRLGSHRCRCDVFRTA